MRIGTVEVEQGILLAPMEDVSDLPFRVICRRLGADIVYTEFISSDGLVRDARRSLEKLALAPEEHPVAIQIFGGDIPTMVEAAIIAEQSGPDFVDINCGCWVKNVVARSAGAALLKDPPRMAEMTRALVRALRLPVTVKTRLGWDANSIVILDVARMLQDAGAAAITVHCRTRDMGHNGNADWSWIPRIKQVVDIPVILNGDVQTPQDVQRAFAETGADAVMIGRAAIANPFIFRQAKNFMATGVEEEAVSVEERISTCLEQLRMTIAQTGNERRTCFQFRKFYAGYLKGMYMASAVRRDLVQTEAYTQVEERLWQYAEFLANNAPATSAHESLSEEENLTA